MTEYKLRERMRAAGLTIKEGDLTQRLLHLEKALKIVIPPKSVSDRTCYRKVINWLLAKICHEIYRAEEILPRVLDYALEATSPSVKNPPAVFMSILKKELNYPK